MCVLDQSLNQDRPVGLRPILAKKKLEDIASWREFAGPMEAAMQLRDTKREVKLDQSNISKCLHGRLHSTGGWIFKYREENQLDQCSGEDWQVVHRTTNGALSISSFGRVRIHTDKQISRTFTPRPAPPAPYDLDEADGYV